MVGNRVDAEPSDASGTLMFDVMKRGIAALGITIGASKGDIRVTSEGAKIGEMTARMSGGFHCQ